MSEFKPIPSYPTHKVNKLGHVLNPNGKRLTDYDSNGYRCLKLTLTPGERRTALVHRLVAEAFIGPIPHKMWVNHKNGIKHDNRLENLEITTPTQNHIHSRDVLKRTYINGERIKSSQLNPEAVKAIKILSNADMSQREIAKAFLVSQPTIHAVITGTSWKSVEVATNAELISGKGSEYGKVTE